MDKRIEAEIALFREGYASKYDVAFLWVVGIRWDGFVANYDDDPPTVEPTAK